MRQFFTKISGSATGGQRAAKLISNMRLDAIAVGAILALDLAIISIWAFTLGAGQ